MIVQVRTPKGETTHIGVECINQENGGLALLWTDGHEYVYAPHGWLNYETKLPPNDASGA